MTLHSVTSLGAPIGGCVIEYECQNKAVPCRSSFFGFNFQSKGNIPLWFCEDFSSSKVAFHLDHIKVSIKALTFLY